MAQPKGFVMEGKEQLGCHLKKSIFGLTQALRQLYLKFDKTIKNFSFKENVDYYCVYSKFKNGNFIFRILYVDDILLASSDISLLKLDIKDLGVASFVFGIEIHRDRVKVVHYHKRHIEKVLKKFNMHKCSASPAPIFNGN